MAEGIWQIPYISSFAAYLRYNAWNYNIVVVVSPLVNLVKDQATKLANIGIPAVTLSDISEENMKVVERGAFSVVYESPEAWLKIDRWRKWSDLYS